MTHNLLIYPSTLPGQPLERYEVDGVTLDQWLSDNVPSYQPGGQQPISATVNGVVVEPSQWPETYVTRDAVVELRPQPQGAGLIVAAVVAAVAVAATILLRPSLPSQGIHSRSTSTRGSSIYEASAEGNRPKLGGVIPEVAGQHKVFPDYLAQPRKYFIDPRTQAVDMMLCIGRGHYSVPDSQIRIGSTPIGAFGNRVNYQVFGPGANVTGHQASQYLWYNAPEVSASLGSSSGLRLKGPQSVTVNLSGTSVDVSGNSITINGGVVPDSWIVGTLLTVRVQRQIVASPPPDPEEPEDPEEPPPQQDPRAVFTGSFADLGLEPGDAIELTGAAIAGEYLVHSVSGTELTLDYPDLTPVTSPTGGTYLAALDRVGARYEILSLGGSTGMTVEKQLANGTPDTAWGGFPSQRSTYFTIRLYSDAVAGEWIGPFLACPPGETTNFIQWDIFAPQGLGVITDSGVIHHRTRTIELQWRPVGGGSWNSTTRSMSANSRDQLGYTFSLGLGGQYTPEVRVRRTSIEETTVQDLDRLEWIGLRCRLPGRPSSYPDVTTLALTLEGSDTIASQSENRVSCIVTRQLEPLGGGSLRPSRSIAEWVRYVAHSIGYTDADLDMEELARLDAIWQARGDTFDYVHDSDGTVKEVLSRCLRPGFAELTIDQGRIRPVRDEPRTTFEHMYTPQNMTGPLQRSVQAPRPDDPDGIDVEYFDDATWTAETVECRLPGDQGFRAEKLRIEGVTNRTRAWRIGMRERRRQKYRRWQYSFSTELDALNSRYMSYCALADDIPGYAQSALVEGVEVDGPDVHLLSSEPLEWQTGKSHVVAWRRPDGTLAGPFPAQPGDDERHVIAQMDEVPVIDYRREPPHLLFGTTDEWSFPVLITSINPRGFESVSVDAVNYDERIYADDNGAPN